MSYITRKMTIAINHHRHRCDTLYPACHLISSTYGLTSLFSLFFLDKIIFLVSLLSISQSLARTAHTLQFQLTTSALLRFFHHGFSSPPSQPQSHCLLPVPIARCALASRPKIQSLKSQKTRKRSLVSTVFFPFLLLLPLSGAGADALIVLAVCGYNYITKLIDEIIAAQNAGKCMCLKKPHTRNITRNARTNSHIRTHT